MSEQTAAERFFLRKAEEVAASAAAVSAELAAVRVRLEEHGRSIQDLRNRHEHPLVSLARWLVSLVLAFILGGLFYGITFGGQHAP